MPTAKITKMQFKNEWESPQGGTIFYHNIELDNGDKGSIGAKKKEPDFLAVGSELEYTLQESDKGNKIKRVQQQGGGFKKKFDPEWEKYKQRLIVKQNCMTNAVRLVAPFNAGADKPEDMLDTLDAVYEHILTKIWEEQSVQETPDQ